MFWFCWSAPGRNACHFLEFFIFGAETFSGARRACRQSTAHAGPRVRYFCHFLVFCRSPNFSNLCSLPHRSFIFANAIFCPEWCSLQHRFFIVSKVMLSSRRNAYFREITFCFFIKKYPPRKTIKNDSRKWAKSHPKSPKKIPKVTPRDLTFWSPFIKITQDPKVASPTSILRPQASISVPKSMNCLKQN